MGLFGNFSQILDPANPLPPPHPPYWGSIFFKYSKLFILLISGSYFCFRDLAAPADPDIQFYFKNWRLLIIFKFSRSTRVNPVET